MSISIDGKVHQSKLRIPYGYDFPKPNRNTEIYKPRYGDLNVYIIGVGVPEWNSRLEVVVPVKYYITEIIEPSKDYKIEQKRKKTGLRLIK